MSWEEMRYFEQAPLKERKKIALIAVLLASQYQTERTSDEDAEIFQNGPSSLLGSPTVRQRVEKIAQQTLAPTSLEQLWIACIARAFHLIESS